MPRAQNAARPASRLEEEDMPAPDDALLLKMLHSMKLTRALEYRIERKLYRQRANAAPASERKPRQ